MALCTLAAQACLHLLLQLLLLLQVTAASASSVPAVTAHCLQAVQALAATPCLQAHTCALAAPAMQAIGIASVHYSAVLLYSIVTKAHCTCLRHAASSSAIPLTLSSAELEQARNT
jgi:hypothetical protein